MNDVPNGMPAPGPAPAAGPVPPAEPTPPSRPSIRVTGTVLVRDQFATADTSVKLENPELFEFLSTPITRTDHPVVGFRGADVTVLDIDNHSGAVNREAVEAVVRNLTGWTIAHATHRDGAHVFFVGPGHRERAVKAAVAVPQGLNVEVKRDARHPLAIHPEAPGATAGPLMIGPGPDAGDSGAGVVTDSAARDRWLAVHEMQIGGRYDHTHCPIDPCPSSGQDPVAVYGDRIACFRCQGQGRSTQGFAPGVLRFSSGGGFWQQLCSWAKVLVHWGHLRYVLEVILPHFRTSPRPSATRPTNLHCMRPLGRIPT
jgi:hypothetical protein